MTPYGRPTPTPQTITTTSPADRLMLTDGVIVRREADVRHTTDRCRKCDAYIVAHFGPMTEYIAAHPAERAEYRTRIQLPRGWRLEFHNDPAVYVGLGTQPTVYVPTSIPNTLWLLGTVKEKVRLACVGRRNLSAWAAMPQ